ncbi:DnaD domain protein [Alkalibacterium subtropicum]|nr:DnaD domain protein [Alkalibacterium subtropicum]
MKLKNWLSVFDAEIILEALTRTQQNGKSFNYLNAILTVFKQKDIKTLKNIEAYDRSFKHHSSLLPNRNLGKSHCRSG